MATPSTLVVLLFLSLLLRVVPNCVAFLTPRVQKHHAGHVHPIRHAAYLRSGGVNCCTSLTNRREAVTLLILGSPSSLLLSSQANAAAMPSSLESKSVRWGIVGLGDVTAVKSGPPFYKCKGSQLVAVMRRTPGAAAEWIKKNMPSSKDRLPCRGYDNLRDFLQDEQLDAVYVATPPGAHLEVALQVAAAGKPAYIEKPVGRCGWETRAISKAFEERGLPLFTAYVSRSYERTQAIISMIRDEKILGDRISAIKYTMRGSNMARGLDWSHGVPWRLNATQSGGGLIMDVGCHVLDRIDYICGPIEKVEGTAENRCSPKQDVEDFVQLHGEIGSSSWTAIPSEGATVDCTWDFSDSESPLDELVIAGPSGSLEMAAMSPSLPVSVLGSDGKVLREVAFEAPQHAAQALIQQVTNELLGIRGARSPSRQDNAIRTSSVLDLVVESYYGGRQDDFWSRSGTWPGRKLSNS